MPTAVLGVVNTQLQAEGIITRLRANELRTDDISVALLERAGVLGLALDRDSRLNSRSANPVRPAGPAGGVMGMLAGIGVVSIPGKGMHITAGPLNAALRGDKPGAQMVGLGEALARMGIPPAQARQYETQVSQGQILLAVQARHADEVERALAVFRQAHALDPCAGSETPDSACGESAPAS